jgi:hypothetical protein
MGGGLLKTIGYFALFYFVMRAMRFLFEPKKGSRSFPRKKSNPQPKKGEFIDYEEVD